jgi:hypothetical protein
MLAEKDERDDRPEIFKQFEEIVAEITSRRKRSLLVMFYSGPAGEIKPRDIKILEDVFNDFLEDKKKDKFYELDLLIQTRGGDANTSYRLIQLIRSYCKRLNVLVATYAHSGGTLITFGADKIEMGRSATLSPIDVQIHNKEESESFALLSIEKFIEFLTHSAKSANIEGEKERTHFITELTKMLVDEVGPADLGELFRLRGMTILHSKILLLNYMFNNHSYKKEIVAKIISKFNQESPTHNFAMDFELVKDAGLTVETMDGNDYKLLKSLIDILTVLEEGGAICHFQGDDRIPFFKIFSVNEEEIKNEKK